MFVCSCCKHVDSNKSTFARTASADKIQTGSVRPGYILLVCTFFASCIGSIECLQCFDAVSLAAGRASGL